MSNAWTQAEELTKKHAEQGGVFVRLANHGDKVVGAFCGEPYAREVHWTGERYEVCTGEGCALCAGGGKKASLRVMLNFFVPTLGEMKVYEAGTRVFKDLLKIRSKYGLESWLFEIERHGEPKSTKTSYSILPETKIDGELRARIDATELNDLEALAGMGGESEPPAPISHEEAVQLVSRLKALPRSGVDQLLQRFGITRVRDLMASDLQAAHALLVELEVKQAPAPAAEIDPFA